MMEEPMSLKFLDKSQLQSGGANDVWQRFPQGAQSMQTAPQNTSTPIIVYEPSGAGHWALYHRGAFRKLAPFKDFKNGTVSWRMDGTEVAHPVAWSMPQKK